MFYVKIVLSDKKTEIFLCVKDQLLPGIFAQTMTFIVSATVIKIPLLSSNKLYKNVLP